METKLWGLKNEFNSKKEILENARTILKKEFIGIDKPIDAVIDNINSWFMLSNLQERPFIINLWGLTGVGKTSLITRLVELIDYENNFFRFDLGHKKGKNSLNSSINELCEYKLEKPVIIALDEFQHARTLEGNERGIHEKEDENRVLWDLIDAGKIQHQIYKVGVWRIKDHINICTRLLANDIEVENGKIVKGWKKYKKEFTRIEEKGKLLIPTYLYANIIDLVGDKLKIKLRSELEEVLMQLDGNESIEFLKKVISISSKPVERDFSKSLIFVLGNLDEAYSMSNNYSIDISADEFYKASLKITVSKIKNALQTRFRHEQISRLGNIHIIYPALSRRAYETIIKNEIDLISKKIFDLTQINILFKASIIDLVYDEGVYPTQGVRPVLTTINHLLRNRITSFLAVILNTNSKANKIDVHFIDKQFLKCDYILNDEILHSEKNDISSELKKFNLNKKDDLQSITAVHESGHAILSSVLLKTIPKYVFSNTIEDTVNGFVFSEFKWKYISKKEIILRTAMFLGGMAAEELIFGKDNVTSGCGSDLKQATNFVLNMLKQEGLGSSKLSHMPISVHTNLFISSYKSLEKEATELINNAYALALETLTKEKKLLLEVSNYLSEHTFLKEADLEDFINTYSSKKIAFIKDGSHLFYRNHLKQLYQQDYDVNAILEGSQICLNKK